MKKLDKKVKYALAVGAACVLITPIQKEYVYSEPEYEILTEDLAYAKIGDSKIYIGNEDYINHISYGENDVLVLDQRVENNNIKIISSHKITDKDMQNCILCVIEQYERENPTTWDRSLESMRVEWHAHNFFYGLNFKKSSTEDVDFENNEENLYNNEIIKKIFR